MTPPCCKKCPSLTRGGHCTSNQTECRQWREWFHEEWTGIQKAAEKIKAQRDAKKWSTVCLPKE